MDPQAATRMLSTTRISQPMLPVKACQDIIKVLPVVEVKLVLNDILSMMDREDLASTMTDISRRFVSCDTNKGEEFIPKDFGSTLGAALLLLLAKKKENLILHFASRITTEGLGDLETLSLHQIIAENRGNKSLGNVNEQQGEMDTSNISDIPEPEMEEQSENTEESPAPQIVSVKRKRGRPPKKSKEIVITLKREDLKVENKTEEQTPELTEEVKDDKMSTSENQTSSPATPMSEDKTPDLAADSDKQRRSARKNTRRNLHSEEEEDEDEEEEEEEEENDAGEEIKDIVEEHKEDEELEPHDSDEEWKPDREIVTTGLRNHKIIIEVKNENSEPIEIIEEYNTDGDDDTETAGKKTPKKKGQFPCSVCDYIPKNYTESRKHLVQHEKEPWPRCGQCKKLKLFKTEELLAEHVKEKHGPFTCDICDKTFSVKQSLINHKILHGEKAQFNCSYCAKGFASRYACTNHEDITHKGLRSFQCDQCGRSFTSKVSLEEHINVHNGVKPFICKICGNGYARKTTLRLHSLSEHNEKTSNVPCPICKKTYKNIYILNQHMKNYHGADSGERMKPKHECEICSRKFKGRFELKKHIQVVHYKIKEFTCKTCSKKFTTRVHLQEHTATHTRQAMFFCEICGEGFIHRVTYKAHVFRHNGAKQCKCPVCHKCFDVPRFLTRHIKDVHRNVPIPAMPKYEIPRSRLAKHLRKGYQARTDVLEAPKEVTMGSERERPHQKSTPQNADPSSKKKSKTSSVVMIGNEMYEQAFEVENTEDGEGEGVDPNQVQIIHYDQIPLAEDLAIEENESNPNDEDIKVETINMQEIDNLQQVHGTQSYIIHDGSAVIANEMIATRGDDASGQYIVDDQNLNFIPQNTQIVTLETPNSEQLITAENNDFVMVNDDNMVTEDNELTEGTFGVIEGEQGEGSARTIQLEINGELQTITVPWNTSTLQVGDSFYTIQDEV